ncbi:MAG: phage tail protein [Caulobacteraceae bacterium]|nr:MAG: phage tail protein [Caulobacteraceae bacterium]
MQLMSLGEFVFGIDDLLFNMIREKRSWRHPSADRVGMPPAYQFVGVGENTLSLGGVLAPGQLGRRAAIDEISTMASTGEPQPLVDGEGTVYGAYLLTDLDTTSSHFLLGGIALKVDWTLSLVRVFVDRTRFASC